MQFSLFGAAAIEPSRTDLDGLMLAGGQWVRSTGTDPNRTGLADPTRPGSPGERARLSVLLPPGWRASALVEELARRELDGEIVDAEGGLVAVRTQFRSDLVSAAQRWTRGAVTVPPPGLVLSAGGLRLWAVASGRLDEVGYLLGTPALDHPVHRAGGAQLAAVGLAAVSIGDRGGPGWRITGIKRVRRLAELLGEPPVHAGGDWPA
jgi:hypothetical protein